MHNVSVFLHHFFATNEIGDLVSDLLIPKPDLIDSLADKTYDADLENRSYDRTTPEEISILTSPKLIQTFIAHDGPVFGLENDSDKGYCVTASEDQTVKVWSVATHNLLKTFSVSEPARCLSRSPSGAVLAVGCFDQIFLMRSSDGKIVKVLKHSGLKCVGFSTDERYFVSGGGNTEGIVRLWSLSDYGVRNAFYHKSSVYCVAVSSDSQILVSGSQDESVKFWRIRDGKLLKTFDQKSAVIGISFLPHNDTCVIATRNGSIMWQRIADGHIVRVIQLPCGSCVQMVMTHALRVLAAVGEDASVTLIDSVYGDVLGKWTIGEMNTSLTFMPSEHALAVGTKTGRVIAWDINDLIINRRSSAQ